MSERPVEIVGEERPLVDEEGETLAKVWEKLKGGPPGVLVLDLDFTLKTAEYELGAGGHNPGELPAESIKLIEEMMELGWSVLVVTNQPRYGHQVARVWRKIRGGKYPIFPNDLVEVLGEESVLGGGADFLNKRYKRVGGEGEKAVAQRITEILAGLPDLERGGVHFVGDREDTDRAFCERVAEKVGREFVFHRVRGSELVNKLPPPLRRFIP